VRHHYAAAVPHSRRMVVALLQRLPIVILLDSLPSVAGITNFVSMDIMANLLLAAGASPAMVRLGFSWLSQCGTA